MPFPTSKTTYVRPLRENHDDNSNQHGIFASPMQLFEVSENSDAIGLNGEVNMKNMDEIKTVHLENMNSIHSKLFAGVEEIQKWKTSVEMESKQKNKKVEQLLQTLEVQRKTILDLQLQNENVSYQLSEEVQQRSFVLENLHSTKELCSALKKHFNTLQGHFEYRNKIEDGFNIADAKRLSAIESLQTKFERVCREHSEKVGYLNDALASETNKALNLKETLEQQIAIFENEKESLCKIIESQQLEIRSISTEIEEERNKFKLAIDEQTTLKFKVQELEGLIEMHSSNLKETEEILQITQNEKLELEKKLLSEKTRIDDYEMEFKQGLEAANRQEMASEKKMSALNQTISSLEDTNHKLETKINEEKNKNEILTSTISVLHKEKENLEALVSKTKDELNSYEQLKNEYKTLEQQTSEFSEKEKYFDITVEQLNEKLLQCKFEKEQDSNLHHEKEENLKKMLEDYQNKLVSTEEEFKSLEESNAELLHKIKMLEEDLKMKADEVIVRDKKILNLDSAINSCDKQLENLRLENITLKDKIESEKVTICLECEQLTTQLKQMGNLELSLQKAEEELHNQKAENMEIAKMLNDTETSYNNDRIVKEKEIIKYQELVHRLENEMRVINFKVEEFSILKSLNHKQKEEIEDLKFSVAKQEEELNELKSENEKLKENLENFKSLTDPNKSFEVKQNEILKVPLERKKRKIENHNQSQNRSFKNESVFSGLEKILSGKKDTAKVAPILLKEDTDSTSSDTSVFEKNNSNVPEKIFQDDAAVLTYPDSYSKKNEKCSSHLEKNKWEVDSSGSEYLELAFDKESEKITGFTPQKSPSSSINLLNTKKPSSINASVSMQGKRDNQSVNSDNHAKKFGLPLKKNKTELGNSIWMQPLRTPDKNVDYWNVKENLQMSTPAFNTPSTPADKRGAFGNTSTPSGQRKFFKTPLCDRENKFKKPTSQVAWSDFLKSSK